jgi:hypothetical protein
MKKMFITMVMHTALVLSASNATAQSNAKDQTNQQTTSFLAVAIKNSGLQSSLRPVAVSEHISKKFAQQFAGATDAVWAQTNEGFSVRFTLKGIKSRAHLTKKGHLQGLLRYFTQEQIPADVRYLVNQNYCHFKPTSATEVQYNGATAYLVTVADETTWKVIRVIDGETEVWKEYAKDKSVK